MEVNRGIGLRVDFPLPSLPQSLESAVTSNQACADSTNQHLSRSIVSLLRLSELNPG